MIEGINKITIENDKGKTVSLSLERKFNLRDNKVSCITDTLAIKEFLNLITEEMKQMKGNDAVMEFKWETTIKDFWS